MSIEEIAQISIPTLLVLGAIYAWKLKTAWEATKRDIRRTEALERMANALEGEEQ